MPTTIRSNGQKPNSFKTHRLTFGKYRGRTLYDIRVNDLRYLLWVYENCPEYHGWHEVNAMLKHVEQVDPGEFSSIRLQDLVSST